MYITSTTNRPRNGVPPTAAAGVVPLLVFLSTIIIMTSLSLVSALQTYQSRIPNGGSVYRNGVSWPGVAHTSSFGGGALNSFGYTFQDEGHVWTIGLCLADDDNDGYTNGAELGDPSCVWESSGALSTPHRTVNISHPAYADSVPYSPHPAGAHSPPEASAEFTLTGYLIDRQAFDSGTDVDGYDMTLAPFMHSVRAALLPGAVTSGYTLLVQNSIASTAYSRSESPLINQTNLTAFVPNSDGTTLIAKTQYFSWAYNLTIDGNKKAVEFLKSLPSSRHNILVQLRGRIDAGRRFHLTSPVSPFLPTIIDLSPLSLPTDIYDGFVADRLCVDNGVSFDGVDMVFEPYKHTVQCAAMSKCVASGYTLLVDNITSDGNSFSNGSTSPLVNVSRAQVAAYDASKTSYGTRSFVVQHNFTTEGNAKVVDFLSGLPSLRNNLLLRIRGALIPSPNNASVLLLDIGTIEDLSPGTIRLFEATGYLIDNLCIKNNVSFDGVNITYEPFKHTAQCALMPQCANSGYSLMIPRNWTGNVSAFEYPTPLLPRYVKLSNLLLEQLPNVSKDLDFLAANTTGSTTAAQLDAERWNAAFYPVLNFSDTSVVKGIEFLKRWPKRKANHLVTARGHFNENTGLFEVLSLKAASPRLQVTGYLVDRLCADRGVSFDGVNMTATPYQHTAHCALMPSCVASGFTLMVDNSNATHSLTNLSWSPMPFFTSGELQRNMTQIQFPNISSSGTLVTKVLPSAAHHIFARSYNFSTDSNVKAQRFLEWFPGSRRNLLVNIIGSLSEEGILTVESVEDAVVRIEMEAYLSDRLCVDRGISVIGGVHMQRQAFLHTAQCVRMPECVASGFTLLADTYRTAPLTSTSSSVINVSHVHLPAFRAPYSLFQHTYNLTTQSTAFALRWLGRLPLRRGNLLVRAVGQLVAPPPSVNLPPLPYDKFPYLYGSRRFVELSSLEDISPLTSEWVGFISDRLCVDTGTSVMGGVNMSHEPFKHSAQCALLLQCVSTGYTMLVDNSSVTSSLTGPLSSPLVGLDADFVANRTREAGAVPFARTFNFSSKSNLEVAAWLNTLPEGRNNLLVSVTGTVSPQTGEFTVTNLTDRTPETMPYYGILSDMLSFMNGVGVLDGVNMTYEPYKHKVRLCEDDPACFNLTIREATRQSGSAGGYTLLVDAINQTHSLTARQGSALVNVYDRALLNWSMFPPTQHRFESKYNFTREANAKITRWLQTKPSMRINIFVAVVGTVDPATGLLNVIKLIDMSPNTTKPSYLSGYLADNHCISAPFGLADDGSDLTREPYRHTVGCAMLPHCVASGYSLLVDRDTTKPYSNVSLNPLVNLPYTDVKAFSGSSEHYFQQGHRFTMESTGKIVNWLLQRPLSRNNLLVSVQGEILTDGTVDLFTIEDASPSTLVLTTIVGYIADRLCVESGTSILGNVNMTYEPYKHTAGCALMPQCIASGYAILFDATVSSDSSRSFTSYTSPLLANISQDDVALYTPQDGPHSFTVGYPVTADTEYKVVHWLRTLPASRNNLLTEIRGAVLSGGEFEILTIRDISPQTAPLVQVVGYLSDMFCIANNVSVFGVNMTYEPFKHTAHCALLPQCVSSGYALLVDDTAANPFVNIATTPLLNESVSRVAAFSATTSDHRFRILYRLTGESTPIAKAFLENLAPSRNNLLVRVHGTLRKNGTLDVVFIEDLSPKTAPLDTVIGYLSDVLCAERGTAFDGTNMTHEPYKHTARCALLPACEASGYVLLLDNTTTTESFTNGSSMLANLSITATNELKIDPPHQFVRPYYLTEVGNAKAAAWLRRLIPGRNNLLVSLTGTITSGNLLDVVRVEDLSPVTGPSDLLVSEGLQSMFSGFHGGGIQTTNVSNLTLWTTLGGKKICEFDGNVGYSCDFSDIYPKLGGLLDLTKLPVGVSSLRVDNQNVAGAIDLRPPFLHNYPYLRSLILTRNAMTGIVHSETFSSTAKHVNTLSLAFNKLEGPLTLTTAPESLRFLDVSGNNFTTGSILAYNLSSSMTLKLDRAENSGAIRRRYTTYTTNAITTVAFVCTRSTSPDALANPSLWLLLSNGSFTQVTNGTIPSHCSQCEEGKIYNVVDSSCSIMSATPAPIATPNGTGEGPNYAETTVDISGRYCNNGCVGVLVGILMFLLVLIVAAVVVKVALRPVRPKAHYDDEVNLEEEERGEEQMHEVVPLSKGKKKQPAPVVDRDVEEVEEGDVRRDAHRPSQSAPSHHTEKMASHRPKEAAPPPTAATERDRYYDETDEPVVSRQEPPPSHLYRQKHQQQQEERRLPPTQQRDYEEEYYPSTQKRAAPTATEEEYYYHDDRGYPQGQQQRQQYRSESGGQHAAGLQGSPRYSQGHRQQQQQPQPTQRSRSYYAEEGEY